MFEFNLKRIEMAISKDQMLTPGQFYPPHVENTIYYCRVHDTRGLIKELILFSFVVGIFSLLLLGWITVVVLLVTWIFILVIFLPKHYKLIQLDKHVVLYGVGSFSSLMTQRKLYRLNKFRYIELDFIRFDQWERRTRGGKRDRFGRIQIKYRLQLAPFHILVSEKDLGQLIKIFHKYRFITKVEKNLSPRDLVLLFSS